MDYLKPNDFIQNETRASRSPRLTIGNNDNHIIPIDLSVVAHYDFSHISPLTNLIFADHRLLSKEAQIIVDTFPDLLEDYNIYLELLPYITINKSLSYYPEYMPISVRLVFDECINQIDIDSPANQQPLTIEI